MGNVLFLFICICFFACSEQVKETHTYISSVYLFVLNALGFSISAKDVVNKPRFHHQLLPKDVILNKDGKSDAASEANRRRKSIVF
jgi:gamma-glutamyltranspeptidase/glutathione hydrolase